MSDLPSRELAQAWLDAGQLRGHPNSIDEWTIVRAYAEGRLPDREAIDYEAGLAYVVKIWTMVDGDAPSRRVRAILWDGIQGGVDAALGVKT